MLRELRRIEPGKHYPAPLGRTAYGTGNAQRLWDQGTEIIDTLAETYLRSRHLVPLPTGLRFHPRCPYLSKPRTQFLPALLVPVHVGRQLRAIQRIFLGPDGRYTVKVMLGTPEQGAWRGGEPGDTLAIAEGFETARAFTQLNAIPCWASLGAGRLHQLQIPGGVSRLYLAGDNDPEGRRAIIKASEAYVRPGLTIIPAPPPSPFKDWATLLSSNVP